MSEEAKITKVVSEVKQPYTVELHKAARGGFYWTIKVSGESLSKVLAELDFAEKQLEAKYRANSIQADLEKARNAPVKRSQYEEDVI